MDSNLKPRVLIFSLAYFPLVGGAEIAVKEITDRLGDSFDFDLITLRFQKDWPRSEKTGHISVFRVKKQVLLPKLFYPLQAAILAQKLHSRGNYQVIWPIMAAYAGLAGLFFKLINPKVPILLTLQEGDSEKHILGRVGIFYPLWRFIFKKADYIQAISNYLADFGRRYGARCPIEVVPNGVDLQKFKSQNAKVKSSSQNSKVIITTSRLVYKNGIDILIKAVAELKKFQVTSYKLQVLGSGHEDQNLKKLAQNLGLSKEVVFLGHVEPDKVPEYLARADVFVRPSRSEGLGNSFLEAMAAGLPVIGTPVGGVPDFIKDGETGVFAKPEDPVDLAGKISSVLSDDALCEKISANGQKLVKAEYSWETISDRIRKILNEIAFSHGHISS